MMLHEEEAPIPHELQEASYPGPPPPTKMPKAASPEILLGNLGFSLRLDGSRGHLLLIAAFHLKRFSLPTVEKPSPLLRCQRPSAVGKGGDQ